VNELGPGDLPPIRQGGTEKTSAEATMAPFTGAPFNHGARLTHEELELALRGQGPTYIFIDTPPAPRAPGALGRGRQR
jgi:hypothetical protein